MRLLMLKIKMEAVSCKRRCFDRYFLLFTTQYKKNNKKSAEHRLKMNKTWYNAEHNENT